MPAGLIVACAGGLSTGDDLLPPAPPPQATDVAASSTASIDWTSGDCTDKLETLQHAAAAGPLGPDARAPFAVELVPASTDWLEGTPELPVEVDLPLEAEGREVPCLIRIGPPRDLAAAHRTIDVEDVRSAYQSGSRKQRNADYDALQAKHREAKANAKGKYDIVETGDPLLDLVGTTVGGLIKGIDGRIRRQNVDQAAAALAATPRSLDQAVYRPYSFERFVVRAQKQAVVPVTLLDQQRRQLRATELRQSERREFFVLRGLDPRDRNYEQHRSSSMTRADFARWSRTPPALHLSSVAQALTEVAADRPQVAEIAPAAGPADPAIESDAEVLFADVPDDDHGTAQGPAPLELDPWRGEAATSGGARVDGFDLAGLAPPVTTDAVARAPEADPLHGSIVTVRGSRTAGQGFYVRDNVVLTTYQLVGATSVVDVTTADGVMVAALVAAVGPAEDLALVHMPRRGTALPLHQGQAPRVGPIGPASQPGRPVLLDGKVVGMVADQGGRTVPLARIRAFLDAQAGALSAVP
ncbi:MAG: hypothetical protein AAF637_05685 [Pseudomonadota bacterium]